MTSKNSFKIVIRGCKRSFTFKSQTNEEALTWFTEIKKHIKYSDGRLTKKEAPQRKFWKFQDITERQMLDQAQTGDILLFRGTQTSSTLIRTLTTSHFDHVGIVIRTDEEGSDDLCIVEAVSNGGVTSNTWKEIRQDVGVGKFYEKVALRKLNVERSGWFLHTLDHFIEESWARNYGIFNLAKFTARGSMALKVGSKNKYVDENRTFFCSELVAKAYKVLRVFATQRSSAHFMPNHFADDNSSLPFNSHCSFSPLHNIIPN